MTAETPSDEPTRVAIDREPPGVSGEVTWAARLRDEIRTISAHSQLASRARRIRVMLKWGLEARDLDTYGFNSGRPLRDAERYLGYSWYLHRVRPLANAAWAKPQTENKWIFYRLVDTFGLPTPSTLGLFDSVHGITWDGRHPLRTVEQVLEELDARRPDGLVLKPVGGGQGKQVLILDAIDYATGGAVTRDGAETTLRKALTEVDLAGMRGYTGYVIQAPLRNHDVFRRLAPWTTNTIRVQTILSTEGVVQVQAAVARLGRRGNMVDSWEQGGVAVSIDSMTGAMGHGILKADPGGRYISHPDTDVPFAGVTVPYWDDTLSMCKRGARLFPGLRSLGWDVVITPDGPVVLEANANWGLQLIQMHTDGLLADPVFRAQIEDLGAPLPDGGIGGVSRHLLSRVKRRLAR